MYFDSSQISLVKGIFSHAEKMAATYFHLGHEKIKECKYEVRTLAHLEDHEISDRAFAYLCKYHCQENEEKNSFQFFRVCLQDNRILDAVERARSFVRLAPLMLYIATHELVHVIRFNSGEIDFDAPLKERIKEEEKVNYITRNILGSLDSPDMGLVVDCFSNKYLIDNIGAIQ
jgi:hypothetical protein